MEKQGDFWVESYQPTDKNGYAVGPLQEFKGRTKEEVYEKVLASNKNAALKMQELRAANKLQTLLGDSADDPLHVFEERLLTADERFRVSKMMSDPSKVTEAQQILLEAHLGAPLEVVRKKLRQREIEDRVGRVQNDIVEFMAQTSEYVDSDANNEEMKRYLEKQKLPCTLKNLQTAYADLKSKGFIVTQAPKPAVQPAPVAPAPAVPVPVAPVQEMPVVRARTSSSGLGRSHATALQGAQPPKAAGITMRDINKMDAKTYSEKLRDPEFRKQVDELYAGKR